MYTEHTDLDRTDIVLTEQTDAHEYLISTS